MQQKPNNKSKESIELQIELENQYEGCHIFGFTNSFKMQPFTGGNC